MWQAVAVEQIDVVRIGIDAHASVVEEAVHCR
jgi:hypothetical protein